MNFLTLTFMPAFGAPADTSLVLKLISRRTKGFRKEEMWKQATGKVLFFFFSVYFPILECGLAGRRDTEETFAMNRRWTSRACL